MRQRDAAGERSAGSSGWPTAGSDAEWSSETSCSPSGVGLSRGGGRAPRALRGRGASIASGAAARSGSSRGRRSSSAPGGGNRRGSCGAPSETGSSGRFIAQAWRRDTSPGSTAPSGVHPRSDRSRSPPQALSCLHELDSDEQSHGSERHRAALRGVPPNREPEDDPPASAHLREGLRGPDHQRERRTSG